MAMTPRERVLTAFAHEEPDRVPLWFGASEGFIENAKRYLEVDDEGLLVRLGDDFRRVLPDYCGPDFPLSEGAVSRTFFGVERHGFGFGQPMSHPLEHATLSEVHDYAWPDPSWLDVSRIREEAEAYGGVYAILGGHPAYFFHDVIDLLGMENMYVRMCTESEVVEAAFQHTADFYYEVNCRVLEAAGDVLDILFIANDFGGQTGPLMAPDTFERFILPHLERLFRLGHDYGLKNQMHCCGGIAPLIPVLADAGLDALQAVQPDCVGMDLATLKAEFGRQMVFNGAIDSHNVLIDGNPDLVRDTVREVLRIMMPGGGYVVSASHDCVLEETPAENVVAMFDAAREFGVYQ